MKRLLIILLSALSLSSLAQEKKTVAVLDPICRDNSVNAFYQQMVRGAMESAVTASSEYEAYDRSAFDQIQKEQAFQRTGAVNDSQIKKMGEMAGVDYVLVSEVSAYEGYLSTIVKILNVTTGQFDRTADDYTQLTPDAVKTKCREMASSLFGSSSSKSSTSTKQVPSGYVDLGLPSGTLWKKDNEDCGVFSYDPSKDKDCMLFTFNQAKNIYGNSLPTKEQWEELKNHCLWTWKNNGYNVKGKNGKSIFLPADGFRNSSGAVYFIKSYGNYWSATLDGSENGKYLSFHSEDVSMSSGSCSYGRSVRLVK